MGRRSCAGARSRQRHARGGYLRGRVERGERLADVYRESEDLVRKHPDSVDAHFTLSYALRYAGLLEESADHCDTALVLDAHTQTSGLRSCAIAFTRLGDYPRALNYIQLDLGSGFAKAMSIDMLVRQGKEQEALRVGSPNLPHWASAVLGAAFFDLATGGDMRPKEPASRDAFPIPAVISTTRAPSGDARSHPARTTRPS